ncbi:MAG: L-fucose isomerase [Spirochaetes bacterium]|nr:L-fucose isomerase [Spirochaetota bacterium]
MTGKNSQGNSGNRLNGRLPKIGIRPIIDGRRGGVRESLEKQTMAMAESVAELISTHLKHSNGMPVECIIPDTTIGGVAEAVRCAEKFSSAGVGGVISVTPCWGYGTETIEMDPLIPKAIWGFNGTERPGAVYLAGALAAGDQKGLPAYKIYGRLIQDKTDKKIPEDVKELIIRFAKAAVAVSTLKNKSYLSMGGVSMGIGGSIVDVNFFQSYLGMRNEYIDMSEFVRRIEERIYDAEEYEKALQWVKNNCAEGKDPNPAGIQESHEQKVKNWETVVKMTLIARDLMTGNGRLAEIGYIEEAEGHNAIAAGFQGQRQWTDHYPNSDFMEAVLNSSFDWNGIREPFIIATENDSLNAVVMLFGHLLSNTAQIFADVRTYWDPDSIKRVTGEELNGKGSGGFIYLTNSGAAALDGTGMMEINGKPVIKPYWDITGEEVRKCLGAARWHPAKSATFRGGGFSSSYATRGGMPFTMSRINITGGLGPFLQIAEGYSIDLPGKIFRPIVERTDPTWPKTFFVPKLTGKGAFKDVYSVMNKWGANHASLSYGHIGADLITLASILRIPVSMHNVEEEKIFRPGMWDAFGTNSPENADYRACSTLGPLYGKY